MRNDKKSNVIKIIPGDILVTNSGEAYVYLGYYTGVPYSFYQQPTEGYLYMFIGRADSIRRDMPSDNEVLDNIQIRMRDHIDGNACYVKFPKKFQEKIWHIELNRQNIMVVYGLEFVADQKPRKKNI